MEEALYEILTKEQKDRVHAILRQKDLEEQERLKMERINRIKCKEEDEKTWFNYAKYCFMTFIILGCFYFCAVGYEFELTAQFIGYAAGGAFVLVVCCVGIALDIQC